MGDGPARWPGARYYVLTTASIARRMRLDRTAHARHDQLPHRRARLQLRRGGVEVGERV